MELQEAGRRVLAHPVHAQADWSSALDLVYQRVLAHPRRRCADFLWRQLRGLVVQGAGGDETERSSLMASVSTPDIVVCDGDMGSASAVAEVLRRTCVHMCLVHAFFQVGSCTTTGARLVVGREPCVLSIELMHLDAVRHAGR